MVDFLSQNEFITQEKFLNKSMLVGHYHMKVAERVRKPVKHIGCFPKPNRLMHSYNKAYQKTS